LVRDAGLIAALAQIPLLFLVLGRAITPFVLVPGILLMYLLRDRRPAGAETEVLVFVRELIRNSGHNLSHSLDSALHKEYSFSADLRRRLARFRLGHHDALSERSGSEGRHMAELLCILSEGLAKGGSTLRSLESLKARLEEEARARNRLKAGTGGMQSVTYLGMAFFLPLFGGISSTILTTSLGLLNQGGVPLQHAFIYVISAYILIVLVASRLFNEPGIGAPKCLSRVIPIFSVSVFIMTLSALYINYAI
jgi:hypothetical protein